METLLLSQQDVQASLSIPEVIQAVEEGYLAFHTGRVQQPDIVSLEVPAHSGETDIKSCYNPSNETMSVKIASGFYDNERLHGLPTMLGTILLLDGRTGAPLCVMDGGLITGIRTGAAGALSARLLARRDSRTVAVLGGGGQARMQIYCLAAVMDIQTVQVYSPRPEELPRYQADVEARTGLRVVPCATPAEAMNGADIAISTTPSTRFLVEQSMVEPGTHIVAVGADMPGKNEWDPLVFRGGEARHRQHGPVPRPGGDPQRRTGGDYHPGRHLRRDRGAAGGGEARTGERPGDHDFRYHRHGGPG